MTRTPGQVLIADDEPYILRSLSFVLRRAGLDVLEARDGAGALEIIREQKPALVFLDIMMPLLDGFEICRRIKSDEALRDIYVIMLTAKGQEADHRRGLESGADEYVTKPFSPTDIVERALRVLGRAPGSEQANPDTP